jgi:hypothetical protein
MKIVDINETYNFVVDKFFKLKSYFEVSIILTFVYSEIYLAYFFYL